MYAKKLVLQLPNKYANPQKHCIYGMFHFFWPTLMAEKLQPELTSSSKINRISQRLVLQYKKTSKKLYLPVKYIFLNTFN